MNRYLTYLLSLYKNKQLSQETAMSLIEEYKIHHQHNRNEKKSQKIAIIGLSARMPLADNAETFWGNLSNGRNCVRTFPESRRKDIDPLAEQIHPDHFVNDKRYWLGGFLDEVDKFDNDFFEILPAEARVMDPQQRIFLELAYEAFQDAGYTRDQLKHSNTGIFLGDVVNEYHKIIPNVTSSAVVGNVTPFITSRVSYFYDLHGPTLNISTTCSTSLVAIHIACQSLIHNECDLALAGAINLRLFPFALKNDPVDALGITTDDGCCRAFDNLANGIVRGEGGGALVLKPYEKAIQDGDHIYAVILGSAVNNDGRSSSVGAPNPLAQEKLLKNAWERSGIDPRTIQYIEAHGTGTKIGDPIEVNGINRAFMAYTQDKQFCGLGSVKTNLGHLTGGASGLTGLIKTTLALKNKKIPPTLHFETPNEYINFADSSIYITDRLIPWPTTTEPNRAGVSAFGFNGTNCHIVVEQAPKGSLDSKIESEYVFVVSHRSEIGLRALVEKLMAHLNKHKNELSLANVCYTLAVCRDHFNKRCAIVATSLDDLLDKLQKILANNFLAGTLIENSSSPLAHRYLSGKIEWKSHFKGSYKKVSLPTYPFEKKRFWIEGARYGIDINELKQISKQEQEPKTISNEQQLIGIFKEVMGLEEIGIEDNFFDLGGDSLLGIQLINEIHKTFNKKITYQDLFSCPRLVDLLAILKGKDEQQFNEIRKLPIQENYELSFGQRRLWILHQMQDNPIAYNMYEAYAFDENLNLENLQGTLNYLMDRHSAFRTTFINQNGKAIQKITSLKHFELIFIDLCKETNPDEKALEHIETFKRIPFDLEKGPLARALLIQVSPKSQIFFFVIHHIIADGWSIRIMVQDLLKTYQAFNKKSKIEPLQPLKIEYHDYAQWQHESMNQVRFQNLEKYWLGKFAGVLPICEIAGDKTRPPVFTFSGSRKTFEINTKLVEQLSSMAYQQNATLFMSLLSSLYVFIYRYTGQQDLIVGTPVSGRSHLDLKSIVGFFVNTLPLRSFIDPSDNFAQLLSKTRTDVLEAFEHQDYPFDLLIDKLKLKRDTSRSPLFNINVAFQNFELNEDANNVMKDLKAKRLPLDHHSCKWDLEFEFIKQSDGSILAFLEYYQGIYSEEMIQIILENFLSLLESIANSPNDHIDLLRMKHESVNLIDDKMNRELISPQCLHNMFELQVANMPSAPCVKYNEDVLTYEEINAKANQLAYFLREGKTKNGSVIGILMENCPETIVAILGVLKAGCAYVPLDIKSPSERLRTIIDEGNISIILSAKKHLALLNNLQWSSTKFKSYICLDTNNIHAEIEINQSNLMDVQLWNHVAQEAGDDITASGWISSYTGLPFTKEEMEEYKQNILQKLKPILNKDSNILEVGCGSGLTAFTLAPYIKSYTGTDLSSVVISKNSVKANHLGFTNLHFKELFADQIDQIQGHFDVVILNSVIHCFPGVNYLRDVLRKALNLCSDQAAIFLGDLMDQDLKDSLENSFNEFKANNFGKGFRTKIDWSRELFVSHGFLEDLQNDFPMIREIQFSKKIHSIENELTRFRYDAILIVNKNSENSVQHRNKHQYGLEALSGFPKDNPNIPVSVSDLAYIIFTSGSTGIPKGVMVEHQTVFRYINWALNAYFNDAQELPCFPFFSPLTFDLTVTSIFCPLFTGSYLRVFKGEFDEVLQGLIKFPDCNILKLTPTHLSMLLEMNQPLWSIRKFILGGEALYSATINVLHDLYKSPVQIYNEYGPTEATVGCIVFENRMKCTTESQIPIGKPMSHVKIHLLNSGSKTVPIGGIGEICVSGECLARGYLNNAKLTSEKFVLDPFSFKQLMYLTGDLGRCLPNGIIEYLGRNDRQVKIKGYRIELNEIESKLYKLPQIKTVAVTVKEDVRGYVVCAFFCSNKSVATNDLKEFLQNELPEYMVPSYFIQMDQIPLSTNGKVDYLRLPNPFMDHSRKDCIPPSNSSEKALVNVWSQVLGIPEKDISIQDDFFDLGGDSIIAMRILPKLNSIGIKLSIKEIFLYRTIEVISSYSKKQSKKNDEPISQELEEGDISLTPIQHWYFEQQNPHPEFFNMANLFRISSNVDEDLLEKAFAKCIEHHDILRAAYIIKNNSIRQTYLSTQETPFELIKISLEGLSYKEQFHQMHAISNQLQSSFDLTKPPLIKGALINLGDNQKRLLIVVHHLVFDGVSWRYLVEDIESLYHSKLSAALPLKSHSFKKWSLELDKVASESNLDINYWLNIDPSKCPTILEKTDSKFLVKDYIQRIVTLPPMTKNKLLNNGFNVNDILLCGLFLSLSEVFNVQELLINHEGHGRGGLDNVDVSRTIGWFTSIYPIFLKKQPIIKDTLKHIRDTVRSINTNDINYGIARYLNSYPKLKELRSHVLFNYFGRVGADLMNNTKSLLSDCEQLNASTSHDDNTIPHSIEVNAIATEEHVRISFMYDSKSYSNETMENVFESFIKNIDLILEPHEIT